MPFKMGGKLSPKALELRQAASRKGGEETKKKYAEQREVQQAVLNDILLELEREQPGLSKRRYAKLISERLKDGVLGEPVDRSPETIRKLI